MITALILFIISILLFGADWYFVQYAWLNSNDIALRIAEICLVLFNTAIVMFGIILIKNAAKKLHFQKPVLIGLSVILIAFASFNSFQTYKVSDSFEQVSVSASIYAKDAADDKYFVTLLQDADTQEMVKMECDKNTYDKLAVDEKVQYAIVYRMNQDECRLCSVEITDSIDNR